MTATSAGADAGRTHKGAMAFLILAVMLDMMAMGLTLPVLPSLIKHLVNGQPATAARYVGWIGGLWAAMSFIASPIIGALSDRFGRRPVLLGSMFGAAVDFSVMALAPTVGWLFLGRALSGVTSSSVVTANAYITDITPEKDRAGRFGLLNAAFGVGLMLGPILGGLLGKFDVRLPFWVAAGLCALNALLGLVVLPESLPRADRRAFDIRRANPLGALSLYMKNPALRVFAAILFLYYLAQQVLFSTVIPYADYRFHWSTLMMGLALVCVGAGAVLVQAGLVRPFVARFGERAAVTTGLTGGVVGMLIYSAAGTGALFLAGIPIYSLVGLQVVSLQALMTQCLAADEQGRLQGANASLIAVTAMIGPPLFTGIFARAIETQSPPATPFYLAAAVLGAALALSLTLRRAARPRREGAADGAA